MTTNYKFTKKDFTLWNKLFPLYPNVLKEHVDTGCSPQVLVEEIVTQYQLVSNNKIFNYSDIENNNIATFVAYLESNGFPFCQYLEKPLLNKSWWIAPSYTIFSNLYAKTKSPQLSESDLQQIIGNNLGNRTVDLATIHFINFRLLKNSTPTPEHVLQAGNSLEEAKKIIHDKKQTFPLELQKEIQDYENQVSAFGLNWEQFYPDLISTDFFEQEINLHYEKRIKLKGSSENRVENLLCKAL